MSNPNDSASTNDNTHDMDNAHADSASTNDDTHDIDNAHPFFLDETKGTWIRAQEVIGLVVRGPSTFVKEKVKAGPGRAKTKKKEVKGPILNMDYIRSTMEFPRAVLAGQVRDADTQLTADPVRKEFSDGIIPKNFKEERSLGCSNTNCSARQLAKRAYHWLMFESPDVKNRITNPKTGELEPNYDLVKCVGFGNTKESKNCLCSTNLRKLMHFDMANLCKGANEDQRKNAKRIHKARWIGFLTKLLEKFQRIPLFADDQETVFAFLSVATPYCSAAKRNAAHDYVFSANGISFSGCHYIPCELLGHHFTYRRCQDFQRNFLSGLAHGSNNYVRTIHSYQKRNVQIWNAMMEISVENRKWPDFKPNNVAGPNNVSTSTIAKHLKMKQILIASHRNNDHVKGMVPIYSKLRKMLLAYRESGYLLVSHPVLSDGASLGIKDRSTSTLVTLEGKESFEGLIHQANAGMAEISDCLPLLLTYYEAIVDKAGHSGRKNLDQKIPETYRIAATLGNNKRKRSQSHMVVVDLSDNDEEEDPQPPEGNYFLTATDGCSHRLQFGGEMVLENCWEVQLNEIAGSISDKDQALCETMHKVCIDVCLHLLPEGKRRSLDSYNVQSSLTFTMNYRNLDDRDYCVEASHLEFSPAKLLELNNKGIYPFVGFVPLQSDGNFERIHPHLDANVPDTMRGNVVFSPLGTLTMMPASMIHGGGMRMGPNGNPCLKVRYFLSEKGNEDFTPLKAQDLGDYMTPLDDLTPKKTSMGVVGPGDVYFKEKHRVRMMAMECLAHQSEKADEEDGEAESGEEGESQDREEATMDASKGLFQTGNLKNLIHLLGS